MKFTVPEMSCGHCKAAIEKAIGALDAAAKIDVDLANKSVAIDSSHSEAEIAVVLAAIGYDATLVAS